MLKIFPRYSSLHNIVKHNIILVHIIYLYEKINNFIKTEQYLKNNGFLKANSHKEYFFNYISAPITTSPPEVTSRMLNYE